MLVLKFSYLHCFGIIHLRSLTFGFLFLPTIDGMLSLIPLMLGCLMTVFCPDNKGRTISVLSIGLRRQHMFLLTLWHPVGEWGPVIPDHKELWSRPEPNQPWLIKPSHSICPHEDQSVNQYNICY